MATRDPSVGIDAMTGGTIIGWDHVLQTIRDMLMTRFGSRWHREYYGTFVPDILGRNITRKEILPVLMAITSALEQWEPRVRVVDVEIGGQMRDGRMRLTLTLAYRPRALLGDTSEQGTRKIALAAARDALIME